MPRRFFELHDDNSLPHRWHLAMPRDSHGVKVDDWQFRRGTPWSFVGRMTFPVEIAGRALDFTEAGLGTHVVHVRAASIFAELAPDDVQIIPVDVEGQPDQYLMIVATRLIRCIDEKASRIERW